MKESKSITLYETHKENEVSIFWSKLGWELINSQEIFNKNSVDLGDSVRTTTTNYVKLTFKRDTEMKDYQKYKALEDKYLSAETALENAKLTESRNTPKLNVVILGILTLFWVIPGIIYFVMYKKKVAKYKESGLADASKNAKVHFNAIHAEIMAL
ncbi:MAG: hypothetical protein R3Y65_09150 [Bacillota bacterium]